MSNLHSSMVRLETFIANKKENYSILFTFQYGQIRNSSDFLTDTGFVDIYIPVWLDQKQIDDTFVKRGKVNLHSSMVRLETIKQDTIPPESYTFTFQYGQIRNWYYNNRFIS